MALTQSQGGPQVLVKDKESVVSIGWGFNLHESFSELEEAGLGGLAMHQVFKKPTVKEEVNVFNQVVSEPVDDSFEIPKMPDLKQIAE